MTTFTDQPSIGAVTGAELAAHAALGGNLITPRYGSTEAERAELRAQGYVLADETEESL